MLYIVPTPIGNLKDITLRALDVLQESDYVLCEDTRTSGVLLSHYSIKKPLHSYHKFNETSLLESIITDLQRGKTIALISDAGTPGISDPGNILIKRVIEEELEYTVLPGASAAITALVLSGFPSPFTFVGFLSDKKQERMSQFQQVCSIQSTLILYVSPHKLVSTLGDAYTVLGDRRACIVREISKKFEQVEFFNLKEGYSGVVKGEFVLLISAGEEKSDLSQLSVDKHMQHYIDMGFTKNESMKLVAKDRGVSKSEVYKETL